MMSSSRWQICSTVPAMSGVPIGHIDDQWTLPLGAPAVLDTDRRTLAVQPTLTIA